MLAALALIIIRGEDDMRATGCYVAARRIDITLCAGEGDSRR